MLKGASVGPMVIGIVFITQPETRLIGILGFLAAAALAGWEWHRRNRAGKGHLNSDRSWTARSHETEGRSHQTEDGA